MRGGWNIMMQAATFEALLVAAKGLAVDVAAPHAADVDARARFPLEAVEAMRRAGLLSATVPRALGGSGCGLSEMGRLCATIAQACGSSAMVLAMHYSQLGCLTRHALRDPYFSGYLRELVERQILLASITSEVGSFGDTRTSICAVQREDGRFRLDKQATTGSYCAHADAMLVTCRRDAQAAASDQLLVLVRKEDATLTQTTSWDTMGMRGTCSPGFELRSAGDARQILPEDFARISAMTMLPYSHVLWSSLWWGIAADAVSKAAAFVRGEARKKPGTVPPAAHRLAEVQVQLQAMRQQWLGVAQAYDDIADAPHAAEELNSMGWALRLNHLKVGCSEQAPQIVHRALQIVGLLGYKNDNPFSLGRQYRDALSASLMIGNDRILAKSASMLLVYKDEG
jgi:acyl-CoA dehydrogenase